MIEFKPGDRVIRTETGETGTVRLQFMDGYVSLDLDDGGSAELDSYSLQPIRNGESQSKGPAVTRS